MGESQRLQQRAVQRDHAAGRDREREADLTIQRQQVDFLGRRGFSSGSGHFSPSVSVD